MKITDLKASATTEVGDTILSSNDMSKKYIDRTNEQTLNKLEYPKLWETYKQSTGDRFVDRRVYSESSNLNSFDFIETENKYLFLTTGNLTGSYLRLLNKNMVLLNSLSNPFLNESGTIKNICGDNENIVIFGSTYTDFNIHYSSDFNIENDIIGTLTKKTFLNTVSFRYVNNHFIMLHSYDSDRYIAFRINKNELFKLEQITGIFETDSILDFVFINSVDFLLNNNQFITVVDFIHDKIITLENNDVFYYNTDKKIIYKTSLNNFNNLEIWENLSSDIETGGGLNNFSYFKNSFLFIFQSTNNKTSSRKIFIFNDNNVKIKQESNLNINIPSGSYGNNLFFIDFENKNLVTANGHGGTGGVNKALYYDSFAMNNKKEIFFNNELSVSNFIHNTGTNDHGRLNSLSLNIFKNKRNVFLSFKNISTLENGSDQYDPFRANFTLGEFPDNFTMPAIQTNEKDKYWTKKG